MRSLIALALVCSWSHGAFAQGRAYAHSMAVTDRGIGSTGHVLASQTGAQILAQGRAAIDVAIAVNAVLGGSNVVDYDMNIQATLSAPRLIIRDTGEPIGCKMVAESRVQPTGLGELRSEGHDFVVRRRYSAMIGRGQAVPYNSKISGNFAASDPRAGGAAEPQPIPLQAAVQQQSRR